MFSNIHLFKKRESSGEAHSSLSFREKVYRDWKILLVSAITLFIVVSLLDGLLLWMVNRGDIFTFIPTAENNTSELDQKTLSNAVKFFDDRNANFEAWKNTSPNEIDPSL